MARFRVNAYRQRGSLAAVVRLVAFDIPDYRALRIPEQVMDLADLAHGMVLVTGTAGSGKSTTLAAMIAHINATRPDHILTVEDPIEYVYRGKQSIIHQREVGRDVSGFAAAKSAAPILGVAAMAVSLIVTPLVSRLFPSAGTVSKDTLERSFLYIHK